MEKKGVWVETLGCGPWWNTATHTGYVSTPRSTPWGTAGLGSIGQDNNSITVEVSMSAVEFVVWQLMSWQGCGTVALAGVKVRGPSVVVRVGLRLW